MRKGGREGWRVKKGGERGRERGSEGWRDGRRMGTRAKPGNQLVS